MDTATPKPHVGSNPLKSDHAIDHTITACPKPSDVPASETGRLANVSVDNYILESEVGRGGMGRVMRATDTRHGRTVAIKEMTGGTCAHLQRFEREALITARLQHPSIVPVYEAGQWADGSPFYAMKLVEGKSLDELLRGRDLNARVALLPKVLAVAEALAYAHSQQIIHRDLKPSNIIVGDYGETVVIDWGLAKQIGSEDTPIGDSGETTVDGSLTRVGSVMGTPAFMPPEQAEGKGADTRSDVYALGAILYQLLGGVRPYKGHSSDEVLVLVLSEPPIPLAKLTPGIPRDLRAIVDKAMARDPAKRYADANELAQELRRFQTGQLVAAHSYSRTDLVRRWGARNRAAVTVAAVLLLVLAVGSSWSVRQIMQERDIAQRERRTANAAKQIAETAKLAADKQRSGAEGLMERMAVDLGTRLRKAGKLDLLAKITTKVHTYYTDRQHLEQAYADKARWFQRRMIVHELKVVTEDLKSDKVKIHFVHKPRKPLKLVIPLDKAAPK